MLQYSPKRVNKLLEWVRFSHPIVLGLIFCNKWTQRQKVSMNWYDLLKQEITENEGEINR